MPLLLIQISPLSTQGATPSIDPLGFVFTVVMGLLLIVLPRRYAILPILALTCFMTTGMRFMLGSLNFTMLRVVLVFGVARVILRSDFKGFKLNLIDKAFLCWAGTNMVAYVLLWQTSDALKYKLGQTYDAVGFYFMFRFLVRDASEIVSVLKSYAFMILPLAGAMTMEKLTGRNPFSVFGGVPAMTTIRDGTLRCQGPFAHPILAGTFGATLAPLFLGVWGKGRKWMLVVLALVAAALIALLSGSSGPVLTVLAGFVALGLWPLRNQMRKLRWGIVFGLVSLHMIMKAPVWFILAKIDLFQSSTGYHRAFLIDRAIANFGDWWLVGTKSTWDWADRDNHLFDVTNNFIQNGVDGGILTLILFIAIFVLCFKGIGRLVRLGGENGSAGNSRLYWALGAALFAHGITFLSVTYFDQNFINWYLLLAMISTIAGPVLVLKRREFLEQLRVQETEESSSVPASFGVPGSGQVKSPVSAIPQAPQYGLRSTSRT
jgi:hypothetical protein